ncbi:hypothetical protein KP509_25G016100 [Ceratopteris richardii]|uniref:Uncharacterized protein n=1 Tax=Ceratopteris richardii TaxID=49495 RepID=A0A8T2RQR7_CERRI|nr:hypothetical protein KP509_25G016100 [Ceratopteris richardii]
MGAQAVSLAVSSLLFITFTCCTDWQLAALADTEYVVINNALNEKGGFRKRGRRDEGPEHTHICDTSATQFIRNTFGYDAGNPSKIVDKVTLFVDDEPTQGVVAFTSSDVSGTPNCGSYTDDTRRRRDEEDDREMKRRDERERMDTCMHALIQLIYLYHLQYIGSFNNLNTNIHLICSNIPPLF